MVIFSGEVSRGERGKMSGRGVPATLQIEGCRRRLLLYLSCQSASAQFADLASRHVSRSVRRLAVMSPAAASPARRRTSATGCF